MTDDECRMVLRDMIEELESFGLGTDDEICGADAVDYLACLYSDLKRMKP